MLQLRVKTSGKRSSGSRCCAGGGPGHGDARIMIIPVTMGGREVRAIIDTGCSTTIVAETLVPKSELIQVKETVQMMDGSLVSVRF